MLGQANTPERAIRSTASSSPSSTRQTTGKRGRENNQKGLRHFSLLVMQKVEQKGRTTYSEVADDLVVELSGTGGSLDQKNIRRRVYDALNVLMAMDIIEKDKNKKEIRWLGLPSDSEQAIRAYQDDIREREKRIAAKKQNIQDLLLRKIALYNLIKRNQQAHTDGAANVHDRLELPFILINAPRHCQINCEMLEDRSEYYFEFDAPFAMNEDTDVLQQMGLTNVNFRDIKDIIPENLIRFLPPHILTGDDDERNFKKVRFSETEPAPLTFAIPPEAVLN
ncbi:hypothetical protein ROZALSC1DRAFT_27313 [Rozella allomycis CSF55]|uniref:Transcription factor E2F/dimerization partner (TDP) domain-containing protein n=1 Tax=Rozella allomycis (strain CSF55) TaxID=988480 RepID=A0A075B3S1_ROZAC|nr:Transcription factor E2F/dimerization partner (TDP) domain-containing protein [Rozella allomycis CSF55]RKP21278.1 hypothetical protein ROZALSC1DRAFT_27313 [Rozella allomycis CSF55]|eukprot:EPZ37077.1 Transcription factor E2F/dimerization partner (TDP) domain-containing protein [Rozella allomycis CSF55]